MNNMHVQAGSFLYPYSMIHEQVKRLNLKLDFYYKQINTIL